MVSEGLCVLSVQSTSSGKHDGGVEVCNDSRHSTGCCDAGLGATVTCLQGRQHMGDLQEDQSLMTTVNETRTKPPWMSQSYMFDRNFKTSNVINILTVALI